MKASSLIVFLAFITGAVCRIYLRETFRTDDSLKSWIKPNTSERVGKFKMDNDIEGILDFQGIRTEETFVYYRLTRKAVPFANLNKTLVLQYEVRFPYEYECGGGYLKVLPEGYNPETFTSESPFAIRFGADICEFRRKIVLDLTVNGTVHRYKKEPKFAKTHFRQLLTFILNPDDTYEIMLNLSKIASGNLSDDFEEFSGKFIYDTSFPKPSDWDDREFFIDESHTRPENWENNMIHDPDFPLWDITLDVQAKWTIPKISNPHKHKEWRPRTIKNPNYAGPWLGKKIPNPHLQTALHDLGTLSAVAIDIWQPHAGVFFDNILLTDDLDYALRFAKKNWLENVKLRQSENYDRELERLTMSIGSLELARTWTNNLEKLPDDEFTELSDRHRRSYLQRLIKKFYKPESRNINPALKKFMDEKRMGSSENSEEVHDKYGEQRYMTRKYFCQLNRDVEMQNLCLQQ